MPNGNREINAYCELENDADKNGRGRAEFRVSERAQRSEPGDTGMKEEAGYSERGDVIKQQEEHAFDRRTPETP